jgi:hypothetical protein
LINCEYSIIEIYDKWKNGIPMSEIVELTGIKRKRWYKKFERMEMKNRVATINNKINNYSDLINHEKVEHGIGNHAAIINENGDKVDKRGENVATINTFDSAGAFDGISKGKNDKGNWLAFPFILLLLIALILLFKWIYENYNKGK